MKDTKAVITTFCFNGVCCLNCYKCSALPTLCLCIINWLTDQVPPASVEKSEEADLKASVSEPVSASPYQATEPVHSTEKSSEPIEGLEEADLKASVSEPVSTAPYEVTEPEHSMERPLSGEPVQFTTAVSEAEHPALGDEAHFPAETLVTPVMDLREDSLTFDDPNVHGVRIYTDTTEGEPQVERDVQETEEVLPDGTVVRRQVVKTSQRQTISTRVVMEGPEDVLPTSKAEAEQLLGEMGVSEELGRQINPSDTEPQASTNVEEHEEVLPDGSVVKRRVVTTTKQHVTTERVSLEDDDIPAGNVDVG